jgi:cytochrome c oxidase cbb3-type subunit 4
MDIHDININHIRAAVTVLSFATFGGIVAWAMARRNQPAFDEAAMLPFLAEPGAKPPGADAAIGRGD